MANADNKAKKDRTFLTAVLICTVLSFTVFFFQPVELFLGNQREFLISFGYIAVPMLLMSLVSAAVLSVILFLISRVSRKVCNVISRLLLGVLISFYVQDLFLNKYMSPLTGDDRGVSASGAFLAFDFILTYAAMFLPLILYAAAQKKTDRRLSFLSGNKAAAYSAGLIFAMQFIGAGSTYISTDLSKVDYSFTTYLSFEPVMELSSEGNIVVFLYDKMDGYWIDEMLEKYPELYDELEGFTYYQNNISYYDATFPSVTSMLTGEEYEGGDRGDYMDSAWKKENVLSILRENGWDTDIIMDKPNTFNSYDDIRALCSNVREMDGSDIKINYFGKEGIINVMTKFSFSRLLPYYMKDIVTVGLDHDFSNGFLTYNRADASIAAVGPDSDIKLNSYINENSITAYSGGKKFVFIHTNGMHNGTNEEVKDIYPGSAGFGPDRVTVGRGTMEVILGYIRRMKEAGVFDTSTVIILGDHARQDNYGREFQHEEVTGLMIKPAGAAHEPLAADRYSELSNAYFFAGILDYAGIPHEKYGVSYNDVFSGNAPETRHIKIKEKELTLWDVTGDARDFDNWEVCTGDE